MKQSVCSLKIGVLQSSDSHWVDTGLAILSTLRVWVVFAVIANVNTDKLLNIL